MTAASTGQLESHIVQVAGIRFHVRASRAQQDRQVLRDIVEHDEYRLRWLSRCLPTPQSILDVGGHIGGFGLLAQSIWPDARLIAIEPNAESCELYERSLQENRTSNACVVRAALNYEPEKTVLIDGSSSTGGCTLVSREAAEVIERDSARGAGERYRQIAWQVPAITVDEILRRFSLDRIDLGKWDCEGGELGAVQHMRPEAAQCFGALIGEYHMPAGSGYREFRALAQPRFPHLRFYESRGDLSIGPFWAVDNLAMEALLRIRALLSKGAGRMSPRNR